MNIRILPQKRRKINYRLPSQTHIASYSVRCPSSRENHSSLFRQTTHTDALAAAHSPLHQRSKDTATVGLLQSAVLCGTSQLGRKPPACFFMASGASTKHFQISRFALALEHLDFCLFHPRAKRLMTMKRNNLAFQDLGVMSLQEWRSAFPFFP